MDGQGSGYFDPTASDLIFCEQDVSRMSPELDMAYSYLLLHASFAGTSMCMVSNRAAYYAEAELLPPHYNTITTSDSNLYSPTPYNPPMPVHPNTNSDFILSPENGPNGGSGVGFGAYMDLPPCHAGSFQSCITHTPHIIDTDSTPRAWNPDSNSVQYDNCQSSPSIGHETADITITKDAELAERDSSSQPDANQSSKSESNTKTNANPSHPFMFNNIEDAFRYPCYGEGCNKTFARKEHATRHYRTKHEKSTKYLTCEFCGKNTFNRSDNLNAHRKLHARSRPRNSNGVHFVPDAVPAMQMNRKRGRPRLNA
ncbi:related to zinc finger protein odd-paired-like (opl) [Fusarium fujikuroi]|nr:related to zinc finger protein odd-paired-like (opl) [Fusarium fujikuroi]